MTCCSGLPLLINVSHQVTKFVTFMSYARVLNLLWQTNLKKFAEFLINTKYVGLECFRRLYIWCRRVQKDPGGSRRVFIGKWYLISWQKKCEHQVTHGDLGHGLCIQFSLLNRWCRENQSLDNFLLISRQQQGFTYNNI